MNYEKRVFDDMAQAVGWTPLVRLQQSVSGLESEIFAKIEFMNPMSSVKDRIARHMVDRALADGRLSPGATIVESSSGNTAMGLAMMSILRGLGCKLIVRSCTSKEKLDCLRAMGVELVLVDGDLPSDDPESYNQKASHVARETENAYFPDQHNNRENNESHYLTTGPEIWEQMDGSIDYFVAGIGTGGTVCGVARYLKEQDPSIKVIAIDPVGSVFYQYFKEGKAGTPAPYFVEGLGDQELIECPEFELIDEMYQVNDAQSFHAARELAKTEAILAGGSSGSALWAVRQLASGLSEPARIVTIFPDSGSRYLSTIYNDEWMKERGFL